MGINQIDYSTLTVSSTALVLAASADPVMPSRAQGALITVENDQVRWRADGTAPTAMEGHLLEVGQPLPFNSWTTPRTNWRSVLMAIQFIRVTNDATLKITWFD